jgi:dephospho-CoA kinase
VVEPGRPAYVDIVETFGDEVLAEDGTLDRAALGRVVYRDESLRRRLEEITHPRIMGTIFEEVDRMGARGASLAVVSAALLVEAGFVDRFDGLLVVWCDPDEQLRRIMERDSFTEAQARMRIEAQMPVADKVARADWVIHTNGSREDTAVQVRDLVARWRDAPQ